MLLVCLVVGDDASASAWGASAPAEDRPALYVPLKPLTRQQIERRDSLKQYALGLLLERADRLPEALKAFEEAARLDPDAAPVFKAQLPLLVSLGRDKDALAALAKVLDLDPGDHEVWFIAARLHKSMGHQEEGRAGPPLRLEAPPGLENHPDIAQQMYLDLASMCEMANDTAGALAALTGAAKILDHPDVLMDHGPFDAP